MAMSALRLRRALTLSTYILNHHKPLCSSVPALHAPPLTTLSTIQNPSLGLQNLQFQTRAFRSSNILSSPRPRSSYDDDDNKIGPDDILFEGCDYNHWLITMDFPKDPKPTPQEMVETYVQTAAKVVGSVEEAKNKIYACSTTTYHGFQIEVTEEMSNKFQGLPGVVFILPDSYIDPVKKEYGGDKYINGTIIPRPPPVHYGRTGGRYNDRNRDSNRLPRGQYQQGNSSYNNERPAQGDARSFEASQNPPAQQNYGPPRVGERRDPMPMSNFTGGQENYQGYRRDSVPQGNYNQGQRGSSYPQGHRVENRNYAPQQGGGSGQGIGANYGQGAGISGNYGQGAGVSGNYGQGAGANYGQAAGVNYGQGAGGNYGQGSSGNFGQGVGGDYGQGAGGNVGHGGSSNVGHGGSSNFGQGAGASGNFGQGAGGNFGQGTGGNFGQGTGSNVGQGGSGNFGQGASGNFGQGVRGNYGQGGSGNFGQGAGGNYGQGAGGNYGQGQNYVGHAENERFSQGEQMNYLQQGQQKN